MPNGAEGTIIAPGATYKTYCEWFNQDPRFTDEVTPIWQQLVPHYYLYQFFDNLGIVTTVYRDCYGYWFAEAETEDNFYTPNYSRKTTTHPTRADAELAAFKRAFEILEEELKQQQV